MSKFWTVVSIILLTGIVLLASETPTGSIEFTDLENECRLDTRQSVETDLTPGNRVSFEGAFHVDSVRAAPRYEYTQTSDEVRLNVYTDPVERPSSFWDDCLGVVKYRATTSKLDEGSYLITVLHNDKKVDEKVYRVD